MCAGKLIIVGIGPGNKEHMTFRAYDALCASDVIVGYTTYVALLGDMIREKEVIATGMTQEIDRVRTAIECARQGKVVALISSGDAGIYGMAGLAFDLLGDDQMPVEVVPGVTAAVSCAALLGAPIMHDSAIISLSDRLTEKEDILTRVRYAAEGDFVIVLYNPRSRTRTALFDEACDILSAVRAKTGPVGLVWHAYREEESTDIISLGELKEQADRIDMFTTIIIGNSTTTVKQGRMVTARGYAAKMSSEE